MKKVKILRVALVIQHAKRVHNIISVALQALQHFPKLLHKRQDIRKKVTKDKMCVLIDSKILFEIFLILKRIQ